jgi:hypothetical protein
MQSAVAVNEIIVAVCHRDVSDIARDQGVIVREVDVGGTRVISEEVGGQVYFAPQNSLPLNVQATRSFTMVKLSQKH